MIMNNFEQTVKSTVIYSYAIGQSLTSSLALHPLQQNDLLLEFSQLKLDDNGEVVRLVQSKLNYLGYYDDLIDGEYGLLTEYALKQFQSSHNIKITGSTNKQTMQALIDDEHEQLLQDIYDIVPLISIGMQNDDVKLAQEKLYYLGYYTGNIDSIYGPLTETAIQQFHKDNPETHVEIEETIINEKENVSVKVNKAEPRTNVIETATQYIGTPYVWGGVSPSGFDCSGFIQFVYDEHNKTIPRTVNEIWNFSTPISSPSIGDLVFFETYKPGPSHMGIYLGNGDFIHAGSSRGVEISNLNNSYWKQNYIGAKKIN